MDTKPVEPAFSFKAILEQILFDLKERFEGIVSGIDEFLIGAVILLVILFIGGIVRFIVRNFLKRSKADDAAVKFGLADTLAKVGITAPLSKVVSTVLFWFIALYAVKAAADSWKVEDISNAVQAVIGFLPKLIVACFILFGGLMIADMVRKAVQKGLENVGIEYGGLIGNALYLLLLVMVMTVVLGQLGVQTDLLNASVKILLASIALAISLSLGLGLMPVAKNVVSGVYARDLFPPGSVLVIDENQAVVREVGPVATRLESTDGGFFVVPNSTLVTEVNRGKTNVKEIAKRI